MGEKSRKFAEMLMDMGQALGNYPDEITVHVKSMATATVHFTVTCNTDDVKWLVGKNGRTAEAIRTILHSVGVKNDCKTYLKIN